MRERSPPLPKITHPSHPVWAIAGFNKAKCNAESPPGGTAYLITVSPVPGKLSFALRSRLLDQALTAMLVVVRNCAQIMNAISPSRACAFLTLASTAERSSSTDTICTGKRQCLAQKVPSALSPSDKELQEYSPELQHLIFCTAVNT